MVDPIKAVKPTKRETWIESAIAKADAQWHAAKSGILDSNFSGVRDAEGNQYVDLVLEGGGMLGLALVGYTYILEKASIRFRKIAGTSAGAINALFLAAAGTPSESKSEKLLEIMSSADFASFEDGEPYTKRTIKRLLGGSSALRTLALHPLDSYRTIKYLLRNKGLNPGHEFMRWLKEQLQKLGIESTAQLNTRINQFPELLYRDQPDRQAAHAEIALVAADTTTETRAVFPRKACLYFADPDTVNPAEYVRASMSVPFFFKPHIVNGIPQLEDSEQVVENWRRIKGIRNPKTYFRRGFPQNVDLVDGGMVSNFPFDIFHTDSGTPKLPTLGVKLELDLYQPKTGKVGRFTMGLINTCRHMLDNHFRANLNAEYHQLVKEIEITRMHNGERPQWLDFSMPEAHREHLFICGANAAIDFLSTDRENPEQGFSWEKYLQLRSPDLPQVEISGTR